MADINLGCKGCKLTQRKKKISQWKPNPSGLGNVSDSAAVSGRACLAQWVFPSPVGSFVWKLSVQVCICHSFSTLQKTKHNKLMRPMKRWNWGNERGLMERGEDIVSKRIHKRYSKHNPNSKIWYCWSSKFCYVTFLFQILAVFISNNSESLKISVKELRCV